MLGCKYMRSYYTCQIKILPHVSHVLEFNLQSSAASVHILICSASSGVNPYFGRSKPYFTCGCRSLTLNKLPVKAYNRNTYLLLSSTLNPKPHTHLRLEVAGLGAAPLIFKP